MVAYTLKQDAEIKVVPACAEIGSVAESRDCAVAYLYAVVGVEFAVAVGVAEEEVAQFGTLVSGEVIRILVDKRLHVVEVGLVAYDTVDRDYIELIDGLAFLGLVDIVD